MAKSEELARLIEKALISARHPIDTLMQEHKIAHDLQDWARSLITRVNVIKDFGSIDQETLTQRQKG